MPEPIVANFLCVWLPLHHPLLLWGLYWFASIYHPHIAATPLKWPPTQKEGVPPPPSIQLSSQLLCTQYALLCPSLLPLTTKPRTPRPPPPSPAHTPTSITSTSSLPPCHAAAQATDEPMRAQGLVAGLLIGSRWGMADFGGLVSVGE